MTTDVVTSLARDVAAVVPLKRMTTSTTAKVPWVLIEALRDALDEAGVDWRSRSDAIGGNKWRDSRGGAA